MDRSDIVKWAERLSPAEFRQLVAKSSAPSLPLGSAAPSRRVLVYPPGKDQAIEVWSVDAAEWLKGGATMTPTVQPALKRQPTDAGPESRSQPEQSQADPLSESDAESTGVDSESSLRDLKAAFAEAFPDERPHGNAGRRWYLERLGLA
jgi:hypothetical protein